VPPKNRTRLFDGPPITGQRKRRAAGIDKHGFPPDGSFAGILPDGPLNTKRPFKPKIIPRSD
jgi:hypothetical protein